MSTPINRHQPARLRGGKLSPFVSDLNFADERGFLSGA
jgi:hypothetical protein